MSDAGPFEVEQVEVETTEELAQVYDHNAEATSWEANEPVAEQMSSDEAWDASLAADQQSWDAWRAGNDAAAKARVIELLQGFGWKAPIDLGDLSTARGTESLLPVWLRLWSALGTHEFNFHIARK